MREFEHLHSQARLRDFRTGIAGAQTPYNEQVSNFIGSSETAVPKAEIDKREAKWKRAQERKKRAKKPS